MDENKNAETLEKGKRHWYVIHTYSGYENKVSANLERKVHSLGMSDRIYVLNEGRIVGEFEAKDASQEKIMACILSTDPAKGEKEKEQ